MDSTMALDPAVPDGDPIECARRPVISPAHTSRLRRIWSLGRPVHVSQLDGIDLDLMVLGFVAAADKGLSPTAVVTATRLGVAHLNDSRQSLIHAQSPHHELGRRLASHLQAKGLHTWENVEFVNPDWTQPRLWGVVRPDVFACLPTLKAANAAPAVYEVKVRRADFLADLARPEKRGAYMALAEAVYYCCPKGLIDKSEVPDGFGLLVEEEPGVFAISKKARRQKGFVLHSDVAMTLMVKRQVPLGRLE